MTALYSYEIKGIYPNKEHFYAIVFCENDTDARAIAQGLRKVTTINTIAVYRMEEGNCIYYDKLKIHG